MYHLVGLQDFTRGMLSFRGLGSGFLAEQYNLFNAPVWAGHGYVMVLLSWADVVVHFTGWIGYLSPLSEAFHGRAVK